MVGKKWIPKDVHVLIPGIGEYVAMCCKKGFAEVIKDLEMGRKSWIILVGPVLTHDCRILFPALERMS